MRPALRRAPTSAPPSAGPVRRVLLIVAALALAAAWFGLTQDQPRVSLAVHNTGPCAVDLSVGRAEGGGTIFIGAVPAGADLVEPRLLDRGNLYRFEFSMAGTLVGTDVVSRDQLEANGWRYDLPVRPELAPPDCATN